MLTLIFLVISSVAFAHSGVKDQNVKERMMVMKAMADNTKVIGQMLKRKTQFNANEAKSALERLSALSLKTPKVFTVMTRKWHSWSKKLNDNWAVAAYKT